MANTNVKGTLLALLAFAIYATSDAVVKWLGARFAPEQMLFFSQLMAFPLLTLMMVRDTTDSNLRPRHPWWVAIHTAAQVLGGLGSFYTFSVLPLAQAYSILFSMPIMITLLAIPVLGERVGRHRGIAIVVGLIGVLIVLRPGVSSLSLGHVAGLFSAFASALSAVIMRRIGGVERSTVLLIFPMLGNVILMGAALPLVYKPMDLIDLGAAASIAVMTFLAMVVLIAAYRLGEAAVASSMQYSQILWAVVFGDLFFHERLDGWTGIGACVVIASGLYIVLRESRGQASENRPVLSARSRFITGIMPRLGALLQRPKQ
ncbi:DMT family transporter [Acidimangrovimonas sediminis]|uniref:DMT family transporter n=1 Tax=Acidimangrovimonas sediminis TaxID=2056283 RepID=UPI000C808F61|nr:DMT family transporter [Acidimangrovimonas sediminis]